MSSPYEQGKANSGLNTGDREPTAADYAEYNRGVAEYQGRDKPGQAPGYAGGLKTGEEWADNPNKTLAGMVRILFGSTVVIGLLVAGVAWVLGPSWAESPLSWGLIAGGVWFWLLGLMTAADQWCASALCRSGWSARRRW